MKKTRVYKVELCIVDVNNNFSPADVVVMLENSKHLAPTVIALEERQVEWSDDHPLNKTQTQVAAFQLLFGKPEGHG